MVHTYTLPDTPAFLYDEASLRYTLDLLGNVRERSGAKILYSVKAQPFAGLLRFLRPRLDGFAVSSLFEARLAATAGNLPLHITTPGLRVEDIGEIAEICACVSFNSLEQCRRLLPQVEGRVSVGLRVNPGLSFLADRRYDPCRPHSKLGIPLHELAAALAEDEAWATRIEGLHFHTLFESRCFEPLRATLEGIEAALGPRLDRLRWLNLGGGYWFENGSQVEPLIRLLRDWKRRHPQEIYLEPGKALAGPAGTLVTSVIDRFERDGVSVAVLDSGVQHLPEVFEYQKPPHLRQHCPDGVFEYLLAGCSCLAGDLFGTYRLRQPLGVGDRLEFAAVGAYAPVKASRFNGHDLPSLWLRREDGSLECMKRHGYAEYLRQWSGAAG